MGVEQLAGFAEYYDEEARLVILKGLAEQSDYRLSDSMLVTLLNTYAINRGRDYVRNQLNWLEKEARAVRLLKAGTAIIAEILEPGLDHVERRSVLEGIKRPSPGKC